MKGLITKTIGELCDAGGGKVQTGPFGSQLHESDYSKTGTPVVMPKDILGNQIEEANIARISETHLFRLRRHKLAKGDIVYGRRGDIGRQALVGDRCAGWLCGTGCLRITLGNSPVTPQYLHQYLQVSEVIRWIENQAIGATMPNLNTNILRRVPVTFPADAINQAKITEMLSAFDELIENNKRRIALLENTAAEIYREWFVRLRFPGHGSVKTANGMPEGWTLVPSSEVFHVMGGGTPSTNNPLFWNGDIPFFTPKDAGDSFYALKTERAITHKGLASCNSRVYKKETIFITARGTVGKICLAHRDMAMNQTCYALAPKRQGEIYFHFLSMKNAVAHIKSISKSGVFDNITADTFKIIPMLTPQHSLITRFNEYVSPLFEQIGALLASNELLAEARELLLPRIMSGKLPVENLKIQLPPAEEPDREPIAATHA